MHNALSRVTVCTSHWNCCFVKTSPQYSVCCSFRCHALPLKSYLCLKKKKKKTFSFFNCPWNWRRWRWCGKYEIKEASTVMLFYVKGIRRSLACIGRLIIVIIFHTKIHFSRSSFLNLASIECFSPALSLCFGPP